MTFHLFVLTFVSKYKSMKRNILTLLVLLFFKSLIAQSSGIDIFERKCFIGSTLFMLANLVEDPEPPRYYQLNLGYRITPKDVISLEVITWKYYEPLGVSYSNKKTATNFPGKVQALGAGIAYKRFLWKRAYTQIHATAFRQNYLDEDNQKIQSGFQLFNTLRMGYQFRLFNNQFFLEPSIACTFWPVNTNLPESFQIEEDKYSNFFLPEPGLHFGFNF